MSTLETFVLQFETKGSKMVLNDIQQISEKTRNLESLIHKDTKAQDLNTKSINKNTQAMKKRNNELWTYTKRLIGVYAIYKLVRKGIGLGLNLMEQGNNLNNMATTANVSTNTIQRWGYAVKRYGGNEQSVAQTMGAINSKLYSAKNFGDYSAFETLMTRYGITPTTTNVEEFLQQVAGKIQGLDRQRQLDILNSAGVTDESMQRLMMSGSFQDQLDKAKIIYSDEDIQKATKAKEAMVSFYAELQKLAVAIGGLTLEPLINTVKELTKFLENPKKYMNEGTGKSITGTAIDGMWQLINPKRYWKMMQGIAQYAGTTGLDFITETAKGKKTYGDKGGNYVQVMQKWFESMQRATDALNTGIVNNMTNKNSNINLNNENNVTLNGVDTSELANKAGNAVMDANKRSLLQMQILLTTLAYQNFMEEE